MPKPKTVAVELSPESVQMLAEMVPAAKLMAASQGVPVMSPADLVGIAIAYMHERVIGRAAAMAEENEAAAEGQGESLWPTPSVH